jgi:quinol-cytochrome oxidoreductase complex cytochrome b subunit
MMALDTDALKMAAFNWVNARLPIAEFMKLAGKKTVPVHKHSVWYYMGGILMVLIIIQFVSGGLLMVHYIPEIESAHASVNAINTKVDFGWLVRSMHSWGANLAILFAFIHMFSAYFMKAYRSPREFTWFSGLIMLVLLMGFGFTGYLLPWDEVAFFASKIGLDITSKSPLVGEIMGSMLRGGAEVGQATISRFFVIHVILLPLALMGLMGLHLLMVQLHGISKPESYVALPPAEQKEEKFFPDFMLKDLMVWLVVVNFVVAIVCLSPWGLGPEADPFAAAPKGIKPEWYFLSMFQFLKLLPPMIGFIEGEQVGMMFFGAIAGGLGLAPFIDNGQCKTRSAIMTAYGVAVLVGMIVFTIWGYLS